MHFDALAVGPSPQLPLRTYERRRRELAKRLGHGNVLVVATHQVHQYANDVDFPFRPHSDFWYLTGFDEPRAALVLHGGTGATDLFVQPRKKEAEIWTGRRLGVERAAPTLGVDRTHDFTEFAHKIKSIVRSAKVHAIADHDPATRKQLRRVAGKRMLPSPKPPKVGGPESSLLKASTVKMVPHGRTMLHDMRLVKDDDEMRMLQKACDLGVEGHKVAAGLIKPGAAEYQVEASFVHHARHNGSTGVGYPSICGCGPNAAVLHYTTNRSKLKAGELFLIDAGCEWGYYTSDITRTYPVGEVSETSTKIYDLVHDAHKAALREVRPGAAFKAPHNKAVDVITAGLLDLGYLKGNHEKAVKEQTYRRYFMHGTSHWLGLDVHDAGSPVTADGKPRTLKEGMVLTVEPGLYFNTDFAKCPPGTKGIGVRIEDDVAVTSSGRKVLNRDLPTDLAKLMDLQR